MNRKQFNNELHKLNSWILYCDENIRKANKCPLEFDYHESKYEAQKQKQNLMANYLKQTSDV